MATACGSLQQIYESPFNPVKSNSFNDLFNVKEYYKKDEEGPFCMMNSESLNMCTEGLGFESLDGMEDLKDDTTMEVSNVGSEQYYYKREKSCVTSFPPPISSLGDLGRSSVCFKSYRKDGRFVLEEVRIPKHEYLHASREDGRLKLSFVESDDDEDDDDGYGNSDEIDEEDEEGKEVYMIEENVKGIS